MKKRILTILVFIFSLLTVVSCTTDLTDYRVKIKGQLDDYLETKSQFSYSEDNWDLILNYVEVGKVEIEEAVGASAIDRTLKKYKELIDKVNTKVDLNETLALFDLTDPKQLWDGSTEIPFPLDRVYVILKKTTVYPELTVDHFYISNMASLEYKALNPTGENPNFRQRLVIYLKNHGKEEVLQAISELNDVEFVRTARPDDFD